MASIFQHRSLAIPCYQFLVAQIVSSVVSVTKYEKVILRKCDLFLLHRSICNSKQLVPRSLPYP